MKVHIAPLLFLLVQLFVGSDQAFSQCSNPPSLVFANPVLLSGTDGQIGAVYRFPNVAPGMDAHIQILGLGNGALLGEIDNTTQGYYDAWQPYVTAGANDTSYLDWHISFKKAGTFTDTVLPCLAVTAVDTDGDNASLKEFIRAATPGAYAVDPFTTLTVTFDGTYNTATGTITTIPSIDTNQRQAMFQMNFANVSSIIYRNGSISTKNTIDVRHTCIYFKPFFQDLLVLLPIKLHSFSAAIVNQSTRLSWMAEENDMHSYTVQRSLDGTGWSEVNRVFAENDPGFNAYYVYDQDRPEGIVYYRLQLTDNKGAISHSRVIQAGTNTWQQVSVRGAALVKNNLSLQLTSPVADAYSVRLYSMQGQLLAQKQFTVSAGTSQLSTDLPLVNPDALYIVTLTNQQGHLVYTNKIIRTR
jgi:hypothetical protein